MTNETSEQPTESFPSLLTRRRRERQLTDSLAGAVLLSLRPDLTFALTIPTVLGASLGAWSVGGFNWGAFLFSVAGVLLSAIAFQFLMAHQDFEQSRCVDARPATDMPGSPFTLQQNGVLPPSLLLNLSALLYTASVLCGLWLALLTGWPIAFFGAIVLLLQAGALLRPVRYAYRGYGMGEAGILLAFGMLPLTSAFYAQTQQLSWLPVTGGLPIALLALLVVLSHNLTTLRRDWLIGKRTLAVILGAARALDFNAFVTMAAYALLLAVTVLSRLPLWYLGGLATLPLAMGAFAQLDRYRMTPEDAVRLRSTNTKAVFWTAVLCIAALFLSRPG